MIRQELYIKEYDWWVTVYYAVTCYCISEIMDALYRVGCRGSYYFNAYRQMKECSLNTGITYSNNASRESVVVIALTSSADEFANSIAHENAHLAVHISDALGIDKASEEFCYLVGNTFQRMYTKCHHLLCRHCRKKK